MKETLIIAHHLIPYTPSYGQVARHLTLINQLAKDHIVHVITVKGKKEFGDFGFKYNKNVKFYHCEDKNYNP